MPSICLAADLLHLPTSGEVPGVSRIELRCLGFHLYMPPDRDVAYY